MAFAPFGLAAQEPGDDLGILEAVLAATEARLGGLQVRLLTERAGYRLVEDRPLAAELPAELVNMFRANGGLVQELDEVRECPVGELPVHCRLQADIPAAVMLGQSVRVNESTVDMVVSVLERSPSDRQPIEWSTFRVTVITQAGREPFVQEWELLSIT